MKKKKFCLLSLIFIFGVWGCTDSVAPITDADQMQKGSISGEPNWLTLPVPNNKTFQKDDLSVTKTVKPDKSTKLEIKTEYDGGAFDRVKIQAKLEFKKGCVEEDTEITMMIDPDTWVITILPHIETLGGEGAELELKLEGQDLEEGDEDVIDFVFLSPEGLYESIERFRIKVKVKNGELELMKGKLPHFSRFGFTR